MAQREEKEPNSERTQEGIGLRFASPESLRAFILNPDKPGGRATLTERISRIREMPLGEFNLDGQLFTSAIFTLVIEPDRDPRGVRPTAIIRADIQLGDAKSALRRFQQAKATKENVGDSPFAGIGDKFKASQIQFTQYSANTARIHQPTAREKFYQEPLALLQLWDKDLGAGSISISLVSLGNYYMVWDQRREMDQWETDEDEVDRWQFEKPVGIDAYEVEVFNKSVKFYEEAFSQITQAIYQAEGVKAPQLAIEIESPLIFEERGVIGFNDIGGQKTAVEFLRALAAAERSGLKLPTRPIILLAGPPGNGKSSLSQALATELGVPLVVKTTRDLPSMPQETDIINFLESAHLEAKAAARQKGGKSVFCLEGIEAFLGAGSGLNLKLQDWFLNTIDKWREDQEVLLVATSNFPELLHPGIVNRFEKIDVLQPDRQGRKAILEIHAAKLSVLLGRDNVFSQVDFDRVVERLEGFSGRDIVAFLSRAFYLRRLESQERAGGWLPMDTNFLLGLVPQPRKLGFQP